MRIKGRVINSGTVAGEALVLHKPFSFIGDFDPLTGELIAEAEGGDRPNLAGKILVIPTGKGGTIAPWVAYEAMKNGTAPAAILCDHIEPITCESALTIDIPLLDSFECDITGAINTGDTVRIEGNEIITDG